MFIVGRLASYYLCFRPCGCGSGDSGCSDCGICRSCAGELEELEKNRDLANGGLLEAIARTKEEIPLDLIIGENGTNTLYFITLQYCNISHLILFIKILFKK